MRPPHLIALSVAFSLSVAATTASRGAEVTLKMLTGLPDNLPQTQTMIKYFAGKVNELGKGVVQIDVIGGPEVMPGNKSASALQRGVIDMLDSPASYYAGQFPDGYAFLGSNLPTSELRKNGAYALLDKAYNKKLNAHFVAWGNSETTFYLYLAVKPTLTADGGVSLKGLKLRSTPTYRPLIEGVGGTPVAMPASDIYTGLQRGVIQGFGWTNVAPQKLGVKDIVKYRIDPNFYRNNIVMLMNLDKWKALSHAAKTIIDKAAVNYETESVKVLAKETDNDEKVMLKAGMKLIDLKGEGRRHYLTVAYDGLWARLGKLIPADQVKLLRDHMYKAP